MKLIYGNIYPTGALDVGIIRDFDFDLAYGSDENNFTLKIPMDADQLAAGQYVYVIEEESGEEEGTEYGGIIDAIAIDTAEKTITYSGRTWQGIIASRVIEPDGDGSARIVSGDANAILKSVLTPDGNISGLVYVTAATSPIQVGSFTFKKYENAYEGACRMLTEYGGKLKFRLNPDTGHVAISTAWAVAYNQEDDFNSVEINFSAQKVYDTVNHLICTGQDDEGTNYTIHLYTDEHGGIRPYSTRIPKAIEDADYILTDEQKIVEGLREIVEVYDAGKISVQKNYKILTSQPANWSTNAQDYYTLNATSAKYEKVKTTNQDVYSLLGEKPDDWTENYSKYYTSDHKAVQGTDTSSYTKVSKKPEDWEANYQNYYKKTNDGTQDIYTAYAAESDTRYTYQTQKPSDWSTNYSHYYQRKVEKTTKADPKTKTKKEKATGDGYETVKKAKDGNAPAWKKNTYFVKSTVSRPPKCVESNIYTGVKSSAAPTWKKNTYYFKTAVPIAPKFKANIYYEQVDDHYAKMVEHGVETLQKESQFRDSISIDNLQVFGEFDIGDIIAVTDHLTGIEVWQAITKKIVSINRHGKNIEYAVGDFTANMMGSGSPN